MNTNITIIGGAGFIGTNLIIALSKENNSRITVVDQKIEYFAHLKKLSLSNVEFKVFPFSSEADFDAQVEGSDIVYHLASTNIPGTSNRDIADELEANVVVTALLLDACVRQDVKKVIFLSSGGAVYGKKGRCPVKEEMVTYPITSYGIQKVAIEKLLYLYRYQYGLDYRVIRLANPYGPYQRPDGRLGVVTTFIYKALKGEKIDVYGNGSVVRDFIYIDDAINGILTIVHGDNEYRTFNLGSGKGISVNEIIKNIEHVLNKKLDIIYHDSRSVDVPSNILNSSRFESTYGRVCTVPIREGIMKTADYFENL